MSTFPDYSSWRVVEATTDTGAATFAAKMLADIGCSVVSLDDGRERDASELPLDSLVARGKDSVGVVYDRPASAPVVDALLRISEVLVADRDGLLALQATLALDDLRKRYPGLTVCACTPFGMTGPMADWVGGEEIVQASSGIMSITGHAHSGPVRIAGAPLTHAAAMFGVSSIIADVIGKRAGAPAGMLDLAVYDTALAFQSAALPAFWLSGQPPQPIGNRHSMAAPWNSFGCADGWVIICAGNHPTWLRLCETIGRTDLIDDPRYATQADRVKNVDALEVEITRWTSQRTVAEVEAVLNAATVAAGSVLPLHDVLSHEQFVVRGLLVDDSDGKRAGGVFNLDRAPLTVRHGASRRGSGTRSTLIHGCGVSPRDYARWLQNGIVFESQDEIDVALA